MYEPIKKSGSLTKSHFIVIHLRPNGHADRHNGGYAERLEMGYRWATDGNIGEQTDGNI